MITGHIAYRRILGVKSSVDSAGPTEYYFVIFAVALFLPTTLSTYRPSILAA